MLKTWERAPDPDSRRGWWRRRLRPCVLCAQGWTEPNNFHVCVTSYKLFFRGFAAFARVRWRRLVIDEMQRVKGLTERHWEAVFALHRSAPLGSSPGSVCQRLCEGPFIGC